MTCSVSKCRKKAKWHFFPDSGYIGSQWEVDHPAACDEHLAGVLRTLYSDESLDCGSMIVQELP